MMRGALSDKINLENIGREWLHWFAKTTRHLRQVRRENPNWKIIDVPYESFIANPAATIREIYRAFDYPFTAAMESKLTDYMAANRKDKYGQHRYSLEQFGLDTAAIEGAFNN